MTTTLSRNFEDPRPTRLFCVGEDQTASDVAPGPLLRECPGLLSVRQQLLWHPLYERIDTIGKLRKFMEDHVFAVWDFMSLTKRLQQELTCVRLPWQMPLDAVMARFINEIVLSEESDEGPDGVAISHLGLYLAAMAEIGADSRIFMRFNALLASGETAQAALVMAGVPAHVQRFVLNTLEVAQHGTTIEVIAAFLYGREDVIPHMFQRMLTRWQGRRHLIPCFAYYLERHIELDSDDHGPAARRLLELHAQADEKQWRAAGEAGEAAAEAEPAPTFTREEIDAMTTEEKVVIHNAHVAEDKDRLVCRKRMVTGSHRKVTECRTVAELEEEKKAADKLLQEAMDHSSGVPRQ